MESKILEILERNSEWLRGSAVPFGMVEENREAIAKEISQLMCNYMVELIKNEHRNIPNWGIRETIECYGFTPDQIQLAITKLPKK